MLTTEKRPEEAETAPGAVMTGLADETPPGTARAEPLALGGIDVVTLDPLLFARIRFIRFKRLSCKTKEALKSMPIKEAVFSNRY